MVDGDGFASRPRQCLADSAGKLGAVLEHSVLSLLCAVWVSLILPAARLFRTLLLAFVSDFSLTFAMGGRVRVRVFARILLAVTFLVVLPVLFLG